MGSNTTLLAERPHDVHRAVERARVLHRDKRVALEHESGYAHEHGKEVVIQRLRRLAQEARPDVLARAKPESASCVDPRRGDRLDELSVIESDDAAAVAAGERERR